MDPRRLGILIRRPDGTTARWSGDEREPENIVRGLQFGYTIPGGPKTLTASLARSLRTPSPDLELFDDVLAFGEGGAIAWEGRQSEFPASHGDETSIGVNPVGYSAHLLDDPTLREIYVDRRFEKWEEPTQDRLATIAGGNAPYDQDFHVKRNGHSLAFLSITDKNIQTGSKVEAWYMAPPGVKATKIQYRGFEVNIPAAVDGPILYGDPDGAGIADSYNLTLDATQGAATLRTKNLTTDRKWLALRMACNALITNKANPSQRHYLALAVYGAHGLTLRTNDQAGDPDGVYASDVIADILSRWAPLISTRRGLIEPSSFVIPHLVFDEKTNASDAITLINGFHLFDWGLTDNREFFWRDPTHYRRRWVARQSEGVTYNFAGPQAETAVNGVVVGFTDDKGVQRTAGPPGSGCDYTDSVLADTSSSNPVNSHGIPAKYGILDVQYVTTQFGAIQIGARWLAETLQTPRRGDVKIVGNCRDEGTGAEWPAWMVRAGDSIRIEDADNIESRIVESNYDHASLSNTLTLDNLPHRTDALMERMGVVLIGHTSTT